MSFTNPNGTPQVGDGATHGFGSDCYPATVIKVSASGKTIWIQDDTHTCVKPATAYGWDDAEFTFSRNLDGQVYKATLRKDGRYRRVKCSRGGTISIGHRRYYQDPHF